MLKAEITDLINMIIKHGHSGELRRSSSHSNQDDDF